MKGKRVFIKQFLLCWYLRGILSAADKTFFTFVNMASHDRMLSINGLKDSNKNPNEAVENSMISDFFHHISYFTQ